MSAHITPERWELDDDIAKAPRVKTPKRPSRTRQTLKWAWRILFGLSIAIALVYLLCLSLAEGATPYLKPWPVFLSGAVCFGVTAYILRRRVAWSPAAIASVAATVTGFVFYTAGDSCLAAAGDEYSGWFFAGAALFATGHILLISAAVLACVARGRRIRIDAGDITATVVAVAFAIAAAVTVSVCLSTLSVCPGGGITIGMLSLFYLLLFAVQAGVYSTCWKDRLAANAAMAGSLVLAVSDVVLLTTGDMCGDLSGTLRSYAVMLIYWAGIALIAVGPYTELVSRAIPKKQSEI
jgi:hypothetical protein